MLNLARTQHSICRQFSISMGIEGISQKGKNLVGKITDAVEKTGVEVAHQVSKMTDGKVEEITEEAIKTTVSQALKILKVAGEEVREKDIDAERVELQVGIGISGVAHLRITADVPTDRTTHTVDVEVS